jgi:transaldolase
VARAALYDDGRGLYVEEGRLSLDLGVTKLFADGADRQGILELRANPLISGFTTNPTLMRAAGVEDYEAFAIDLVALVPDRPISFEVFSDDADGMIEQALKISSWGEHVHVKIPVTDTAGRPTTDVQRHLSEVGVKMNVTALLTVEQVRTVSEALAGGPHSFVSVFAGRIADTGTDPVPVMTQALEVLAPHRHLELIWASPREILNVVQAAGIGCHVITVTHELLKKLPWLGRDHLEVSLDTVRMFHRDAQESGYSL